MRDSISEKGKSDKRMVFQTGDGNLVDDAKTVFISHSSEDKKFVHRLAKSLSLHGIRPWIDEAEILAGHSTVQDISEALDKPDLVIVVLSKASLNSPWVMRELNAAISIHVVSGRRSLIPVIIEPVRIPAILRDIRYVNFNRLTYSQGLKEIIQAILSVPDARAISPSNEIIIEGSMDHSSPPEKEDVSNYPPVMADERLDLGFFLVSGTPVHYRTCRRSDAFSDKFSPIVFDPQFDNFVPTPEFGDTKSAIAFETHVHSHSMPTEDFNTFLRNIEQIIPKVAANAGIWDTKLPMYWSLSREEDMDYGIGAENALLALHAKREGVLAGAIHFSRFNVYKPTCLLLFYADLRPDFRRGSVEESLYLDVCLMRLMMSSLPFNPNWVRDVFQVFQGINQSFDASSEISDALTEEVSVIEWETTVRHRTKSRILGFMGRERGADPRYDQSLGLVVDMAPFKNVKMVQDEERNWNFHNYGKVYNQPPTKFFDELPVSVTNPVPNWLEIQSGYGTFPGLRTRQIVVGSSTGSGRIMSVLNGHSAGVGFASTSDASPVG
jgi:hypothetical protein